MADVWALAVWAHLPLTMNKRIYFRVQEVPFFLKDTNVHKILLPAALNYHNTKALLLKLNNHDERKELLSSLKAELGRLDQ